METASETAMHVTETKTLCSSLNSPKVKDDEITSEKEEELLNGNNEDSEDEDTFSDDSFRLRVSDEEQQVANKDNNDEAMKKDNEELGSELPSSAFGKQKSGKGEETNEEEATESLKCDGKPDEPDQEGSKTLQLNADDSERKSEDFNNGNSEKTAPYNPSCLQDSSQDKLSYTGYFGNYSISGKPIVGSKSLNTTSSTSEKYYNQNAHYGPANKSKKLSGFKNRRKSTDLTHNKPTILPREKIVLESSQEMLEKVVIEEERSELPDSQDIQKNNETIVVEPKESRISEPSSDKLETDSFESIDEKISNGDAMVASECQSADSTSSQNVQQNEPTEKNEDFHSPEKLNDETDVPIVESSTTDDNSMEDEEASAEKRTEEKKRTDTTETSVDNDVVSTCAVEAENSTRNMEALNEAEKSQKLKIVEETEPEVICDFVTEHNSSKPEKIVNRNGGTSSEIVEGLKKDSTRESKQSDEAVHSAGMTKNKTENVSNEDQNSLDVSDEQILSALNKEIERNETKDAEVNEVKSENTKSPVENNDDMPSSQQTSDSESKQMKHDSPKVAMDPEARKVNVTSSSECTLTDKTEPDVSDASNATKSLNDDTECKETLQASKKRRSSETSLEEIEVTKRMRTKSEDDVMINGDATEKGIQTPTVENTVTNSTVENAKPESDEKVASSNVENELILRTMLEDKSPGKTEDQDVEDSNDRIDDCEVIEVSVKRKHKRSRRSLNSLRENILSQENSQETETIRQKRRTAQNAEEIIRKELTGNSDSESNDSLSKFVTINYKATDSSRATSPPTLKRNYEDDDIKNENATTKKLKSDVTVNGDILKKDESMDSESAKQTLRHVRQFFRRDSNGSLCKLKQEELEELLIQKIAETLTMRDEIGKLREQARVTERNQEATRLKCQQLAKQIKDFEMVLSRYKCDLRANPDSKTVVPIKINRSVGLQVHFITDHGIQNLRQIQQSQKHAAAANGNPAVQQQQSLPQQSQPQQTKQPAVPQQTQVEASTSAAPKRVIKVRSPRRPEIPANVTVTTTTVTTPVNTPHTPTITPAALVVSKPLLDSRLSVTPANQQATVTHPQLISSNQTILVNGNVVNQPARQAPTSKTKNSDLIDLTEEEEKTKTPQNTIVTAGLADPSPNASSVPKITPRFHTVIQTIPSNVAITTQQGIRVVQPSSQPTPTALVNNMNAPRLTYVTMQNGMVPRQVVITSTPTPIQPTMGNSIRASFPISGQISTNPPRIIRATGSNVLYKHPAALPEPLNVLSSPAWKLPPPAPSLKISKKPEGIVLSWNMALSDKYADIVSYQLYAYQEISGVPPSSSLWKKVGDVRALQLPMACTLTQFSQGNTYYFAVRAVDKHSRFGHYSQPGNISL